MLTIGTKCANLQAESKIASKQTPSERPVIRESYDFRSEFVHVVIFESPTRKYPHFQCYNCGITKSMDDFRSTAHSANVGSRLSGGRNAIFLHPHCLQCQSQSKKEMAHHDMYSLEIDKFCQRLNARTRISSRNRKIFFALNSDDVLAMYLKQRGICAISGLEMDWKTKGHLGRNERNYKGVSIDRINSQGNYVINNVHLVMQIVNIMKTDLPTDMFVAMCRQIADHNVGLQC